MRFLKSLVGENMSLSGRAQLVELVSREASFRDTGASTREQAPAVVRGCGTAPR